jgi:GrpB-like predicted nucleotidyltransferase (UPF0157 family)
LFSVCRKPATDQDAWLRKRNWRSTLNNASCAERARQRRFRQCVWDSIAAPFKRRLADYSKACVFDCMKTKASADFGLSPGELRYVLVGPEWARRFADERSRLTDVLGSAALDIQHIGSTAVPGLTAKPILDMAVAIRDFESGHVLASALVALGYTYLGENGIPRRHFFVRAGSHHLHIFEREGSDWRRHLRFRDRLLGSPDLAARYLQVKLAAAKQAAGDRDRYQDLKSSFIEEFQNSN